MTHWKKIEPDSKNPTYIKTVLGVELLFLPFQVILLLIQIISLFAQFFHAFQLFPHSLSAIWLYLLIFPGQIADCIIVLLYLLRQAYPIYQILHFFVRFVKFCFCYDLSHSRIITFFSMSAISSLSSRLISKARSGCLIARSACS